MSKRQATPAVLTFGEVLVGYASLQDTLRQATTFTRFAGGADLNVAVGLTRLGTPATWASVLGDDAHGDYIIDTVAGLGVGLAVQRAAGSTALMFKAGGHHSDPEVLQVRGGTAFARHAGVLLTPEFRALEGVTHLHLTGIVLAVSPEARSVALTLLDTALSKGLTVSFDPNLRLNLWPNRDEMRSVINTVASRATVVLPGLGEAHLLTGHAEPRAIADFYLHLGVDQVAIKLGKEGADVWTADAHAHSRRYQVNPVDTVGAGDGFAAGYLNALLTGADLQCRIDQAAAVGALVTTRRGDLAAMPTRAALDDFLAGQHAEPAIQR